MEVEAILVCTVSPRPGDCTLANALKFFVKISKISEISITFSVQTPLTEHAESSSHSSPSLILIKALYGHPESGGHWERHLEAAVKGLKGEPVKGHPSSYYFSATGLLLTVYVDDLLLSGPKGQHEGFWKALSKVINIDPPEQLSRFLGRSHTVLAGERSP